MNLLIDASRRRLTGAVLAALTVVIPFQGDAKQEEPRAGIFLVAAPSLLDPNFSRTVVLLVHHGPDGTLGVVVNRPTEVPVARALPEVKGVAGRSDPLFRGGPVAGHTLVLLLRSGAPLSSASRLLEDVWVSFSPEALSWLIEREGAGATFRAYAGYAGWAPGQLQSEIERRTWYLVRADSGTLFDTDPQAVWEEMVRRASELLIRGPAAPQRTFRIAHFR